MSVPVIEVFKVKNSDATWTVKLYHMHSVYTEVTFSHVAFAEELATEYYHAMVSEMHRQKAIDFSEIDNTPQTISFGTNIKVGSGRVEVSVPGDLNIVTDNSIPLNLNESMSFTSLPDGSLATLPETYKGTVDIGDVTVNLPLKPLELSIQGGDTGEQVVTPKYFMGMDVGLTTDTAVATLYSVDENGNPTMVTSEPMVNSSTTEEKPLELFTAQGFDSEGQPTTPAVTIEASSKEEVEEYIGQKIENVPVVAVDGIPVEAGEAAVELYESQSNLASDTPCQGANCGVTDGNHSEECLAEHAAITAMPEPATDTPAEPTEGVQDGTPEVAEDATNAGSNDSTSSKKKNKKNR
jgi:hypothetical protein